MKKSTNKKINKSVNEPGGLAQLARAPALQAGGHRFDSDILHERVVSIETLVLRLGELRRKKKLTGRVG